MGGGASKQITPSAASLTAAQAIEDRLKDDTVGEKKTCKILLLGAGECGKSTILKQMKILHLNGFTKAEEEEYKKLCLRNTMDAIQQLLAACHSLPRRVVVGADGKEEQEPAIELLPDNVDKSKEFLKIQSLDVNIGMKDIIKQFWADPAVHAAKERENEFHLLDSCAYFLDAVDRVFDADFVPTEQDILRARLTTTGIIETSFDMDDMRFRVFDVGGQRGERKKWIHCFDDVTAIMFIASLSEYDQVLAEDRSRNRLEESLDLFEGIVNMPWFETASIILFLNKNDLFEKKILKVPISEYHEEFEGKECDYEAGLEFIRESYKNMNQDEERQIYIHVTDATNTGNVKFVWHSARHTILNQKITQSGLAMC